MSLVPPTSEWNDAPLRCLQLNDEWVSFITGMLWLGEQDWYWDTDVDRGVQGIRQIIEYLSGSNCMATGRMLAYLGHRVVGGGAGGGYINGANYVPMSEGQIFDPLKVGFPGGTSICSFALQPGKYHIQGWHKLLAHSTLNTSYQQAAGGAGVWLYPQSGNMLAGERHLVLYDAYVNIAAPVSVSWVLTINQARATNGFGEGSFGASDDIHGFWAVYDEG